MESLEKIPPRFADLALFNEEPRSVLDLEYALLFVASSVEPPIHPPPWKYIIQELIPSPLPLDK